MPGPLEVRGVSYRMIRDLFPRLDAIVGLELASHFENVDIDDWYDAGPYLEVVKYLNSHISPQVIAVIGYKFVEIFSTRFVEQAITSPELLLKRVSALYAISVRGQGAGGWYLDEFEPGRAVVRENGVFFEPNFAKGVLKSAVEAVGGYHVRVRVLDERTKGADFNTFLVEWLESGTA